MNVRKYLSPIFALLFFCGCFDNGTYDYIREEKEGYYTQDYYQLNKVLSFEKTIAIPASVDQITDFTKKLKDRTPKWCTSGTEQKPHELWKAFFEQEIAKKIVSKLKEQKHNTRLLENYYGCLERLLEAPTEENKKKLIDSTKNLQDNDGLIQAFKRCITETYDKPETLKLTKAILEYQSCLYFILNKPEANYTLHAKLIRLQSYLQQWEKNGYKTGQQLWQSLQQKETKLLHTIESYTYQKNKRDIAASLRLLDQLANDCYSLTYKDLLETLPNGIKKLHDILYQLEFKKTDEIKLLTDYLKLVEDFYRYEQT